jgi:hypothetical protein
MLEYDSVTTEKWLEIKNGGTGSYWRWWVGKRAFAIF